MFAFAILDERTGHLVLARDQLGIKPLYFLPPWRGRRLRLGAEGDRWPRSAPSSRSSPAPWSRRMLYYWVPDQRCALARRREAPARLVGRVPPRRHARSRRSYWDVAEVATEAAAGPPADLGAVIEESVAAHLVADVPVSTLPQRRSRLEHRDRAGASEPIRDIDAYTITFRPEDQRLEAMPDDAVYARKVAAQYGIELHEIEIAPDIVELLPRMVDILDEPIGDPAAINTLLICEAARDAGVKVLLSGMGADELFGGYRKHLACVIGARYRELPAVAARRVVRPRVDRLPGRGRQAAACATPRWAKRFLTLRRAARRRRRSAGATRCTTRTSSTDLLEPRPRAGYVDDVVGEHRAHLRGQRAAGSRQPDVPGRHADVPARPQPRLHRPGQHGGVDRGARAVRRPEVVPGGVLASPGSAKIQRRRRQGRAEAGGRGWLPTKIVHRPKASFGAPLRAWIRNDLRERHRRRARRRRARRSPGFLRRAGAASASSQEEHAGREDRSKQIWQLLTLELWYRQTASWAWRADRR